MKRTLLFALLVAVLVSAWWFTREVVLHQERSPFQLLTVVEDHARRCLRFGEGPRALNQTCRSRTAPDRVELDYARVVVATSLSLDPEPSRALIIGLGGGSIPTALAAARPQLRIDAVELDPAVISIAERYFDLKQTDRLHAIAQDGVAFVANAAGAGERYDLVILDAFDEQGIPAPLFTAAFLRQVRSIVEPRTGVFIANTFARGPRSGEELSTARAILPDLRELDVASNRVLVAGPARLPLRPSAELERIGATADWLNGVTERQGRRSDLSPMSPVKPALPLTPTLSPRGEGD